jgi:V8-like Glu-specific endopeptidase
VGGLLSPTAAAATGQRHGLPGVDVHTVKESAAQIDAHWTPERMKRALAHPEPLLKTDARRKGSSRAPQQQDRHTTASADAVQPKAVSGRTAPSSATTLAAAATEISVAQEVPYSTSFPNVMVGKLFFDKPNGDPFSCTASVIVSNNKRTLWTAGHCVHLGDGSGAAGWSKNVKFIPGYKDGQAPWGTWYADKMFAPNDWTASHDSENADLAAIVLKSDATYGNLQDNVGGLGYVFGSVTDYSDAATYGYPGDGYHRTDMTGQRMMFCYGNTEDADPWWPTDDRLKMDCDMGHGASGGPMFIGALNYNPQIVGANSHYESDATTGERLNDDLFSSLHDDQAVAVINQANTITS